MINTSFYESELFIKYIKRTWDSHSFARPDCNSVLLWGTVGERLVDNSVPNTDLDWIAVKDEFSPDFILFDVSVIQFICELEFVRESKFGLEHELSVSFLIFDRDNTFSCKKFDAGPCENG